MNYQILSYALIITSIILFLFLFGSIFVIRQRYLILIRKIIEANEELCNGNLQIRINNKNSNKTVQKLYESFNAAVEFLEKSFEKEKHFFMYMTHELQNPISVIIAGAELLSDTPSLDKEEQKSIANKILSKSKQIRAMNSKLLILIKGFDGKIPVEYEKTDLSAVVEAVLEQYEEEAAGKQITLINQSNPIIVQADANLLVQMLLNLIGNSIKYNKPGGCVWVRTKKTKDETYLSVIDNGIGIEPENIPFVFDRFYRTDIASRRIGSGLGLPIVKWVADAHGWKIDVESNFGSGTKITVHF